MEIDPHQLDDDALKREMESALEGVSPEELEKAAQSQGSRGPAHGRNEAGERSRIQGRVVGIRDKDVFIDYGGKAEGFISLDEFDPEKLPVEGELYELIPHGFDHESGLMRLSLRETKTEVDWDSIAVGDVIEARVTGTNIGGLELNIHGVRAFMPKSQVDIVRHEDFRGFVGQRLECEITELDRKGKNVLVSRRKVLERRRDEERDAIKATLEVGQTRQGEVKRLTDFGAFVDIGGIEGLLHVSDMSYSRIGHPKELLSVGDKIDVQILKIDQEKGRISLGKKQLSPDPWDLVEANYRPGQTVDGRVTRLLDFGAFVELEDGIEGLIPISEMSWTQRVRHPKEIVGENDQVRVSVLSVDPVKRRISLSLKALGEDPWTTVAERYAVDTVVSGAILRTAAFGAFVQLEEGVEGLVHISELSHERVRAVTDVVNIGDVIQCKVTKLDLKQRRISLSIKALSEHPAASEPQMTEVPKEKKKREKPRRGGLAW